MEISRGLVNKGTIYVKVNNINDFETLITRVDSKMRELQDLVEVLKKFDLEVIFSTDSKNQDS